MSKHKHDSIDIAKLVVNVKNPRYEETQNQQTAILELIKEQKDKIINLAKDIANERELNPSQLPIISPLGDGTYEVLEGNRRVVALKLLHTPDIIKTDLPTYHKKFKSLHTEFMKNPINEIECVVYENREDANHWIKLKHIGEDEGRGVVNWDSYQKQRFEKDYEGKTSVVIQVIDFVKEHSNDQVLNGKLNKMHTTNLVRLIGDKDVQDALGITIVNGQIQSEVDKSEVAKGVLKIVRDITDKKIKVRDIYEKNDRLNYISKHLCKDLPDKTKKASKPWAFQKGAAISPDQGKRKRGTNQTTTRRKLIPNSFIIKIKNPKLNAVYDELRKLDVERFRNAVAVLFRVFFELSIDEFMSKKSISKNNPQGHEMKLREKAQTVVKYFKEKDIMKDKELKGVNVAIDEKDNVLSINTFNAYLHNKDFHPIPSNLILAWDNLSLFMEKLWSN
jgi:hypothetical protein